MNVSSLWTKAAAYLSDSESDSDDDVVTSKGTKPIRTRLPATINLDPIGSPPDEKKLPVVGQATSQLTSETSLSADWHPVTFKKMSKVERREHRKEQQRAAAILVESYVVVGDALPRMTKRSVSERSWEVLSEPDAQGPGTQTAPTPPNIEELLVPSNLKNQQTAAAAFQEALKREILNYDTDSTAASEDEVFRSFNAHRFFLKDKENSEDRAYRDLQKDAAALPGWQVRDRPSRDLAWAGERRHKREMRGPRKDKKHGKVKKGHGVMIMEF